jgi:predicted DNA-binding transcriptional regulator AlpA
MSSVTDSSTDVSTIRPPTLAPPLLVNVKQACQMLGLGRTSIHHLVVSGQLKPVRICGAVRFSVDHLREFVDALSAQ